MRLAVSRLTSVLFWSARETVECETRATRAMSLIETEAIVANVFSRLPKKEQPNAAQ
jgi:hypothetical protein